MVIWSDYSQISNIRLTHFIFVAIYFFPNRVSLVALSLLLWLWHLADVILGKFSNFKPDWARKGCTVTECDYDCELSPVLINVIKWNICMLHHHNTSIFIHFKDKQFYYHLLLYFLFTCSINCWSKSNKRFFFINNQFSQLLSQNDSNTHLLYSSGHEPMTSTSRFVKRHFIYTYF
jgi:hypothetical protein